MDCSNANVKSCTVETEKYKNLYETEQNSCGNKQVFVYSLGTGKLFAHRTLQSESKVKGVYS